MPEWLLEILKEDVPSLRVLLARLLIAFAYGWLVAAIHASTCGQPWSKLDRPFLATLILLAVLVALVTLVIGDSLARAFSLAGALAIIRFRTVVEDTRDTAFVIYAVVSGMAAGVAGPNYVLGPVVCAPLVFLTGWVLRTRKEISAGEGTLVLRLAGGRTPGPRVDALLNQHLTKYRLIGLSTARGGSALDATYIISMPAPEQVFALVTELGAVEGVQGVELKGG
jgi:hypothetical protein